MIHELIQPGETIVMAGRRGHGKTATAVSLCQHDMAGDFGHENVAVITNVVFGRKVAGGQPVEDYPPGVYHEDTLAGTMRRIGAIVEEYGRRGANIIWLLDEAQNFMMADQNGTKENLALTKYLGNARKFGVCNIFLTPTINNLAPRVRCFPQGEGKSGYCSCQMMKDRAEARKLVGNRADPRSVTFFRTDPDARWTPVFISPTSWIRDIYGPTVSPGDFGYDTVSTATFNIGENGHGVPFSFEKFIRATSGGLSHQLPEKIEGFFAEWDREGEKGKEEERTGQGPVQIGYTKDDVELMKCRAMHRRRLAGDTWPEIAEEWAEPKTTLQYQYRKWLPILSGSARGDEGGRTEDGKRPPASASYIQPYKAAPGGGGSPSQRGEA